MIETPFIYPICNIAQKITLKLFADWKVLGIENVPPMGPLIVVANHQSNFDPSLLGVSLPRRIWFLAKDSIFRGAFANWFFRSYGAFPLNRKGRDIRAFRWALNQLAHDRALLIYPEGTRSKGSLQKAKTGVVRLAMKSQAPLLPVAITGTEQLGTQMRVLNPTGVIRVNIGKVFSMPVIEGNPSDEVLQSLADMIMQRIAALLPEKYQGVYKVRANSL